MSKKKHHRKKHAVPRGEQRRGVTGGVYGVSYGTTGGYLNPDQFGYTTAQADGLGDAGGAAAGGGAV